MTSSLLLGLAILLPVLLCAAFLLGRHMRDRDSDGPVLTPVTRQHIELYQGGQLSEAAVEAVKRRYRALLEEGEVERVEADLRPGIGYVVQVRALAEIGTDDACRILERQLSRRLSADHLEQAWYWIDLATCLRSLNRDESLPLLLDCMARADDFPFVRVFAAETISFLGFAGYLKHLDTPTGRAALRILHRAIEGLRLGEVPPTKLAEARIGEILETVWDERPGEPHPLLVRLFVEVRRHLRRSDHAVNALADEPYEQESFNWQMSRVLALEPAFEDYLEESGPALLKRLPHAPTVEQRDILLALDDLRIETAPVLLPLIADPRFAHAELATAVLRWSHDPKVGPFLRDWVYRSIPLSRRLQRRKRPWPPRRASVPMKLPYRTILRALRGHPALENERFLLLAAHDWDPTYRAAAIGSFGWWEPVARTEVLHRLQDARFDPSPEVRHAARAALARLGERQSLQWFRQALCSENAQRVQEAIHAIAVEELTLLWPDLDRLAETEDSELALFAREAMEQLQEELDFRAGR